MVFCKAKIIEFSCAGLKKNANAAHGLQIFIVAMDVELSESICSRCLFFFCSNSILPSRPCESDFAVEWLRVHK